MDAVARQGQAEPGDADRVVGSIHEDLLGRFAALGRIGVIRIGDERDDFEFAFWDFGFIFRDGTREEGEEVSAAVVGGDFITRERDFDEGGFWASGVAWQGASACGEVIFHWGEVWEGDGCTWADIGPIEVWVEAFECAF